LDVHDVHVAVPVQVEEGQVVRLGPPLSRHHLDVGGVHVAVIVEVTDG
jgi:hypothetical protein